ncbi:MAG: hypothetical protein ACP5U2_17475 [Bryobacteraceae bacterium]
MATLPNDWNTPDAAPASRPVHWQAWESRLPPLPFEDVYLFRKAIDNSRLERVPAQNAAPALRRLLMAAGLLLAMLIVIFLPHILLRAGERRLLVLRAEHQSLLAQKLEVEAQEAARLSPQRLEEWARTLDLVDPAPSQVLALSPRPDQTLAARVRAGRQQGQGAPVAAAR